MIHRIYHSPRGDGPGRALLVMLPGMGMKADDFAAHGFVSAVHARGLPLDILAAQPELDTYLEGRIDRVLHHTLIEPAMARGYARLWLLGISLGGMGALLYTAAQLAVVAGLVLLAPFLWTPGTIAELSSAGGITAWFPQKSPATAVERKTLLWLHTFLSAPGKPSWLRAARPFRRGPQSPRGAFAAKASGRRRGRSRLGNLGLALAADTRTSPFAAGIGNGY
jgi:pimeloyl-ACP methyl ester carboxylesterase